MLIVKVKICGITNYEDAIAAIDMGADMLGFNFFAGSPRFITPHDAEILINRLPAFVDTVGLFVNETVEKINEVLNLCQLNWIQLHGDEDSQFCRTFLSRNVKTMKAIRVKDHNDIESARTFFTDAVLLDAFDPAKYGGTGVSFDWNIIGNISQRIFLAGGINPDNIASAVKLGVYGVNICSGIESAPGKKDHKKMKQLFDNIRFLRG
jgi:phosphoribosylanthranilate isomerase